MKRIKRIIFLGAFLLLLSGCCPGENEGTEYFASVDREKASKASVNETVTNLVEDDTEGTVESEEPEEPYVFINAEGMTLESRILTPEGYKRVEVAEDSLAAFLHSYPMEEQGSPVLLYDGSEKYNQNVHISVFALPIENYDLQQCADSVIRMYAEYFYATGQYDRIAFHYTSGFLAEYSKWRQGMRIKVNGNDVSWASTASYDDSYECFVKYLKNVFTYAGTLSLNSESKKITLDEAKAGDVFLYGGSPGHVVMIVDVCEDDTGKKAYLLAQGYMPAQEFHVLKNELHEEDPWYYEEEITYPFITPEYIFDEGSLKRLSY